MRDFTVGQRASATKTIGEADIRAFAALTGDFNPLHTDDGFARRSRFGGRIAHGMLTAGVISTVLGMHLPGPGGIFLSQTLRFVRPVRIGDTITATAEVTAWDPVKRVLRLRTTCANQRGETVVEGESALLVDEVPGDGAPGDKAPGDKVPGDELPRDGAPGNEVPGNEVPGNEVPGNEVPVDKVPGDEAPEDGVPEDEAPGEEE